MQFSTVYAAAFAAMAFLAVPTIGAPSPNIEARFAELDTRANDRFAELDARSAELETRAAALICQFGGVKACTAECILKGKLHGGYCNKKQVCVCNKE